MSHIQTKSLSQGLLGSTIILSLLVGCAAFFPENPSSSGWVKYRLTIDERQLLFQAPPVNHGLPPIRVNSHVNLSRDLGPHAKETYVLMLRRSWDYKGWFWQGKRGILAMAVSVIRKEADYPYDLRAFDHLQEYIQYQFQQDFEMYLEKLEREGSRDKGYVYPGPPEGFERVSLAQGEWLKYDSERIVEGEFFQKEMPPGSSRAETYVLPLSASYFLQVGFVFADTSTSRGYESDWRTEAVELAKQIQATIQWK